MKKNEMLEFGGQLCSFAYDLPVNNYAEFSLQCIMFLNLGSVVWYLLN